MKEAEKTCLELAQGRLELDVRKKELQWERKQHGLYQQLAEVHTLEEDLKARCERLDQEHAEIKAQTAIAAKEHSEATARVLAKERQRDDLLAQASKVEAESGHHQAQVRQNQLEIADLTEKITELTERRMINRQTDKYLHNRKLELKGNIRVFCRVRPILPHELEKADRRVQKDYMPSSAASKQRTQLVKAKAKAGEKHQPAVSDTFTFRDDKRLEMMQGTGASRTTPFKFDRVFNDSETQEAVYDEVKDVVRSALDGYNVCIFAYG